jgi:glutamate racemase
MPRPGPWTVELKIVITDSGVGGLSVCAALESALRQSAAPYDIDVVYLNAALEDDYSYNAMPTRQEKLQTFGNFLHAALDGYAPDLLFIACNTLTVLFEDPFYDAFRDRPVLGIVDTGAAELLEAHRRQPQAGIIVFATETTIGDNAYGSRLAAAGVPERQYVQQACPGLPDAISNDATGALADDLLADYVPGALAQFEQMPEQVLAFLGCTHYGYQAGVFERHLRASVDDVRVINPNIAAAAAMLAWIEESAAGRGGSGRHRFRVVSRYAIPSKPLRSLPLYLGENAPDTLAALRNFSHQPSLFEGARG